MSDKTVFKEAEDIIYGDREQTYGHPAKNLEHIADQWALYLSQKHGFTGKLSVEDVCWMMVDLKKCREMNAHKRDNIVDAIGYIGLAMRVREHREGDRTVCAPRQQAKGNDGWVYLPEGEASFGDCPVDPNTRIDAELNTGRIAENVLAGDLGWHANGFYPFIAAYRIARPGRPL